MLKFRMQPLSTTPRRIVVLDDHDIVRFGLETLFADAHDLELVGSAPSLEQGLPLIGQMQPDLVVCDLSLTDSKGLETLRSVLKAQSSRHVLVVSMHDELLYGEQAIALGARGYLMKETAHAFILQAIRHVLDGRLWISQPLNARILRRLVSRRAGSASGAPESLSLRELEVLDLLRAGKSTKEIAFQLGLSPRTIDIHRANIKRKLGLRSGTELLAFAITRA